MNLNDRSIKSFLEELHQQTKGDIESQVSMYGVGAAIGLAKTEAGSLAEELMVTGLVELRTLSGGISITREGLASLGLSLPTVPSVDTDLRLSAGPTATTADCETVRRVVETMKNSLSEIKIEYKQLEEIIIDLKTIEIQMLSPSPKIAILREILRSLYNSFHAADLKSITAKLAPLIR
jgi:hypothetical protein